MELCFKNMQDDNETQYDSLWMNIKQVEVYHAITCDNYYGS